MSAGQIGEWLAAVHGEIVGSVLVGLLVLFFILIGWQSIARLRRHVPLFFILIAFCATAIKPGGSTSPDGSTIPEGSTAPARAPRMSDAHQCDLLPGETIEAPSIKKEYFKGKE